MRVLYVNHTSLVSGGERSLLDLLRGLSDDITPAVACPEGPLAGRVRALGVPVHPIRGTDASLKLHPMYTAQAAVEFAGAAAAVVRAAHTASAEVVHANSIRSGIITSLAAPFLHAPIVVHVRDRLPPGRASAAALAVATAGARLVLTNSRFTAAGLPKRIEPRIGVAHSPVDVRRFDPDTIDRDAARRAFGLTDGRPALAVVGQLTQWKGQDTAIRALGVLRDGGVDARLLIAGSATFASHATRLDNRGYLEGLHRLVDELHLREHVSFLGPVEDVPSLLAAADVLLVPSTEEPFGRIVIEGMAMGLPVLATTEGGPCEIISDGRDGLLVPPARPEAWAEAATRVLADASFARGLGDAGKLTARGRFSLDHHVAVIMRTYSDATAVDTRRDLHAYF